MSNARYSERPWSSPIPSATIKPRHKFGIDGRLLLVPILFPCAVATIFAHGMIQFAFIAGTLLLWLIAKAVWEWNPWIIDDFQREIALPHAMTDTRRVRSPRRGWRQWLSSWSIP
ncbi:MAG: hypothetical protein ACREM8_02805 [Vulcanimicrobiaceae bacterium]